MAYGNQAVHMRGDPGLLGAIAGGLGGLITGGPAGAIAGAIGGYRGTGPSQPRPGGSVKSSMQVPPMPGGSLPTIVPKPGAIAAVQRLVPGGKTGLMVGQRPAGFHPNKSSYFLKSGEFVPEGTRYVKNRRRNFANGRALRKAVTRVQGFERLVKRNRKALRALSRI